MDTTIKDTESNEQFQNGQPREQENDPITVATLQPGVSETKKRGSNLSGYTTDLNGDVKEDAGSTADLNGDVKEDVGLTADLNGDVKEDAGSTLDLNGDVKEDAGSTADLNGDVKEDESQDSETDNEKAKQSDDTSDHEGEIEELKEYTEEEREVKKKEMITSINDTLTKFAVVQIHEVGEEGESYTEECIKCLFSIERSYWYFKEGQVPYSYRQQCRTEVAKALVELNSVEKMCEILEDGLKRRLFKEDDKLVGRIWIPLNAIVTALGNYSDVCDEMKTEICKFSSIFNEFTRLLDEWRSAHLDEKLSESPNTFLILLLTILHNCAALEVNVPILRNRGLIQTLTPYMDSPADDIPLLAVACLADIVCDEETHLLKIDVSSLKSIIDNLKNSVANENHKHLGWHADELARAVRRLSRNGNNKKTFVDEGVLPFLVTLVDTGNMTEVKEALDCLRVLSSQETKKSVIVQDSGLAFYQNGKQLSTAQRNIKDACQQALWSLRERMDSPDSNITLGKKRNHVPTAPISTNGLNYDGNKQDGNSQIKEHQGSGTQVGDRPGMLTCSNCGASKETLKKCLGCKVAAYCNRSCQTAHWKEHKSHCSKGASSY